MMPEMDGLTLCRKIRQNVNINYLPIILLTARTSEEDNLKGLDTGADAYLMKPFSIELLRKTVLNLIRRREQLRNAFSGRQNQEEQISIPEVKSPDDRLMERVMRVINENLGNPALTVEMISTEVGIAVYICSGKLKELTNQTTQQLIRNLRLKQALSLLGRQAAWHNRSSHINRFYASHVLRHGIPRNVWHITIRVYGTPYRAR